MKSFLIFILALCFVNYTYGGTICASGFTMVNNKCLKLYNNAESRSDAQAACGKNGGAILSELESSGDNAALINFVKNSGHSQFWIGLQCFGSQKSKCEWDNVDSLQYDNFASGNPVASEGCVALTVSNGQWSSKSCDASLPFVCEVPTTQQDCAPGNTCQYNFNNYCYHHVPNPMTFADAENHCNHMAVKLHLVSIHNLREYILVSRIFKKQGTYWLGGKMPVAHQITWLDGTPNDWSVESRVLDGVCMQMEVQSNGFGGRYLSKNCGYKTDFICKRPVHPC